MGRCCALGGVLCLENKITVDVARQTQQLQHCNASPSCSVLRMPTLPLARSQRVVGLSDQLTRSSGSVEIGQHNGGLTMRIWISIGMLLATTVGAYAQDCIRPVPEIDAFSGLAAMGVVGSIAALIWERRRKK